MNVYYVGALDGMHNWMVAAKNQKEACELLQCSAYAFRQQGGHKLPMMHQYFAVAMSAPKQVWKKKIDYVHTQCWVFA